MARSVPRGFGRAVGKALAGRNKDGYEVHNGVIRSPGKFEGEPEWAPAFYEMGLDGGADEDEDNCWTFNLTEDDYKTWPSLRGSKRVVMCESDQGFIYTDVE